MAGIPIIGLGEPSDPKSLPLYTRKRKFIPNVQRMQRPPQSMDAAKALALKHGSPRVRSLCSTYNCVGLVFASRRTCVDTAHVEIILEDDGYVKIGPAEVLPGDIVLYRDGIGTVTHIGIVVDRKALLEEAMWATQVVSQWGTDGEYVHAAQEVPELYGKPVEFWRMGPLAKR